MLKISHDPKKLVYFNSRDITSDQFIMSFTDRGSAKSSEHRRHYERHL